MKLSFAFHLVLVLCLPVAGSAALLSVPNSSFESPDVSGEPFFGGPIIDFWEKTPEPPGYDTNVFGAWFEKTGVFFNVPSPDPISGIDGSQGAFIFSFPGAGFFQDYESVGGTNAEPDRAFDARYQVGREYRMTVGLTTSSTFPVTEGATLLLRLFYRDAASNRVTVAETTVTFSTNVFTNIYQLRDYEAFAPQVVASDPWAGKRIGIEFVSSVAPELIGGVWDLDHVRLMEFVPPTLTQPVWSENGFGFTLLSEPGLVFEVLSASDAALPLDQWAGEGAITNVSGIVSIEALTATQSHRFFAVRQVP